MGDRSEHDDEEEEARAFILARRAKFVAAALASAGIASAGCDGPGPFACLEPPMVPSAQRPPQVCLSPPPLPTASDQAPPMVCLSPVAPPLPEAGAPASGAAPKPTVKPVVPARPAVCLRPPRSGGGGERKGARPLACLTEFHRPSVDDDEES